MSPESVADADEYVGRPDQELDWPPAPPVDVTALERAPRKHRHEWRIGEWVDPQNGGAAVFDPLVAGMSCRRCGKPKDEIAARRGRNNRARGNAIEREVAAKLGLRRVGQYGGATDVGAAADWLVAQVKSGGAYPERIDRLLRGLTADAGQLRAVIHATAEGSGNRRRALITMDLDEFRSWFGDNRASR